jgi:SAM-dependent methyltransferase
MSSSYERYYATSVYDARYPRPNPFTLGRLLRVPAGTTVLDIGAGNGRYALPLAEGGYNVVAVERSTPARAQLRTRIRMLQKGTGAVRVVSDVAEVDDETLQSASAVLLLFGVLGHMNKAERRALLVGLGGKTSIGTRIIGSVPNRYRRFRFEQREHTIEDGAVTPRFRYERELAGELCSFEYTAYSPSNVERELRSYGWVVTGLWPETTLTERIVTTNRVLGFLDALAAQVLPAAFGYCVLFEGYNNGEPVPRMALINSGETSA